MVKKKILITGVAGFIGYSIATDLLNNYKVYGIDNFDNYYNTKLKKKRLNILKKNSNFHFKKIDITNTKNMKNFLSKNDFTIIIHLAAQAGVRYSLLNPQKYYNVNVKGFNNLLENLNCKKIKKIIYASSSSVYGDTNKFPVDEKQIVSPKNPYGISKKINEDTATIFSQKLKVSFVGLRFFTIYGEWGRPDMFILKFLQKKLLGKMFYLNNNGHHYRDFTYIQEVVKIVNRLIKLKMEKKNYIFNVCTSKPIYIKNLSKVLSKETKYSKIKNIKINKADVLKTHGNNKKLIKFIGKIEFTNFKVGLQNTLEWFNNNKNLFN